MFDSRFTSQPSLTATNGAASIFGRKFFFPYSNPSRGSKTVRWKKPLLATEQIRIVSRRMSAIFGARTYFLPFSDERDGNESGAGNETCAHTVRGHGGKNWLDFDRVRTKIRLKRREIRSNRCNSIKLLSILGLTDLTELTEPLLEFFFFNRCYKHMKDNCL